MINLESILKNIVVPLVPVMQIIVTAYSAFKPITGINVNGTLVYSLFTGIVYFVLFKYYYKKDNRYIPLICSIGLIAMNLVSWTKSKFNDEFFAPIYDWSTLIICAYCIILIVLEYLRRRKEYVKIK